MAVLEGMPQPSPMGVVAKISSTSSDVVLAPLYTAVVMTSLTSMLKQKTFIGRSWTRAGSAAEGAETRRQLPLAARDQLPASSPRQLTGVISP
jgi:hypothetical protein